MTVAITLVNATKRQQYVGTNGNINGTLTDTDGDTINVGAEGNGFAFKPLHDDFFEDRQLDPGASASFRVAFIVPSDATLQQMKISTNIDNSGDVALPLVYDVSTVK